MALTNYQMDILAEEIHSRLKSELLSENYEEEARNKYFESDEYFKIRSYLSEVAVLKLEQTALSVKINNLISKVRLSIPNYQSYFNEKDVDNFVNSEIKKQIDNAVPTLMKVKGILVQNVIAKKPIDIESVIKQLI